jgi:Xaa-Pro dipeptidase
MQTQLPFTTEEFRARVAKVQGGLRTRGLEALLVSTPENIYYLTGYTTTGYYTYQALLVGASGEPTLVIRLLELVNAQQFAWTRSVVTYQDHEDPLTVTARAIADRGLGGGRLGVEQDSWFLTSKTEHRLRALLPGARVEDGSGMVEAARMIKSQAEVAYLRHAARIATKAFEAALEATREGNTEADVAAAAYQASVKAGGHYPASPMYVPAGPRSGIPHATWSERRLERGDVVFYELPASYHRYSGFVMRTAVLGPTPDRVRRMTDAVVAGLEAAIQAIKPGVTSGEVDAANRQAIARAGFAALHHHRTGYSLGVAYPPGSGEGHIIDLKQDDARVLEPGMVFHLVPHIYEEGVVGVGVDETVVVTEGGRDVLLDISRGLIER